MSATSSRISKYLTGENMSLSKIFSQSKHFKQNNDRLSNAYLPISFHSITIKQYKVVNKMHIADQCTKCCIQDKSIRRIIILDTKSILRTSHKRKKFYKLRPRKTMKHGIKRNLITNNRS